jgi:hypothetical protein
VNLLGHGQAPSSRPVYFARIFIAWIASSGASAAHNRDHLEEIPTPGGPEVEPGVVVLIVDRNGVLDVLVGDAVFARR